MKEEGKKRGGSEGLRERMKKGRGREREKERNLKSMYTIR